GTCLRPYPLCTLHFKARRGNTAARQVDWKTSKCGNPINFNMAYALVSKDADSPCSNAPVECSLCDDKAALTWTYNLSAHWGDVHKRSAGPFTYKVANTHVPYEISENELKWMEAKWGHRFTKSKSTKEKPKHVPFRISEAHKSSMAL
ncbi:hypothetical protein B0H13DRAFT_1570160, partial [Mycena leptocephala]